MAKKNIDDLRDLLFGAIEGVKSGTLDVERARMIGDLSQVMVDSAKVEVEYEEAAGHKGTAFLDQAQQLPDGITGIRQHRMNGLPLRTPAGCRAPLSDLREFRAR